MVTMVCVVLADASSPYWRYGPNDDLVLISVPINSWERYIGALGLIAFIQGFKVFVQELGMPVLGFSIYNPDKKVITEFSKNELQFLANAMFMVSAIRDSLLVVVVISQLDITLWTVFTSEIVTFGTIRLLLNEKEFKSNEYSPVPLEEVVSEK
jgi:hypothetical protein